MTLLTATIEAVAAQARSGRVVVLMLDFDGTLSPIVDNPSEARLLPGARTVLEKLATTSGVILGLVSGRSMDDLKRRIAISAAWLVGTNGLELEHRGTRIQHGDAVAIEALLNKVAGRLRGLSAEFPGSWVEVKPLGLTLHYRHVMGGTVSQVAAASRRTLEEFGESVVVSAGPAALEVVPAVGATKGTAVRTICDRTGIPVFPCYAGDSDNDLPAFETTDSLGGITIGVGSGIAYPVQVRMHGPSELVRWLQDLSKRLIDQHQVK